MSLRTFPLTLTGSDQTIFTVPPNTEGTANNILVTGTGDLTLKYFNRRTGSTTTIYDGFTISDGRFNEEKSFNLESGDRLIASGDGLSIFVSVYFVSQLAPSEPLTGPGPQEFIGGNMSAGFFGEVDSSELFTPLELDFLLGFTEGVPMSDAGWLKFARNGKILYVQKRPMRHSISWDHIYSRGAVYGTNDNGLFPRGTPTNQYNPLRKGGFTFVPRLLTGAASDPIDTTERESEESCTFDLGGGSEWNELIYRVHQDEPFCGDIEQETFHGGPQVGSNWFNYSNSDLRLVSGNGRGTWVQETPSDETSNRIRRGNALTVANLGHSSAAVTVSTLALRLVLELEQ